MADSTSGPSPAGKAAVPFGRRLNRLRNLALQGVAEQGALPAAVAPHSDYHIEIGADGLAIGRPDIPGHAESPPDNLAALAEKTGKMPVDLIFTADSCIDLRFTLPDASLPEMRQIIDNEIQYRSPFNEGASLWFWVAEELPDYRWQARAAVMLKEPVARLMEDMAAAGLRVGAVRRYGKETSFAAYPEWAGHAAPVGARRVRRWFAPQMRYAILGAGLLCLSAIAFAVQSGMQFSALRAEAAAAQTRIAAQAAAAAQLRSLDLAVAGSTEKLALTGVLSELLPDGVWLDQLVIEDDTVTLIGFAPSAAEITRLLAGLPQLSDIRFASPVTRDNTQSLERFRIAASLAGAGL